MNQLYFLMQGLLSALLCYASLVSLYISFIKNKHFDLLTLFWTLTLVGLAGLSVHKCYKFVKKYTPLFTFKKKTFPLLMICLINLFIGFFNVSTQYPRAVSQSEMGQFMNSLSKNVIKDSKRQQQPPLDYYFSSFSQTLFGENKFAIRFHAMFFYLLLSLILPLGIYFFCSSIRIAILGSLLFDINHVVRLHAVDARPLCLALFTGFLFLFFYLSYITNKKPVTLKQEPIKKSLFPIFASQYLFVVSIGLQPIIFIISLFLSSFWLLLQNKKTIFKKLFLTHIATGILTAPFYINMFSFGKSALKFKEVSTKTINSYLTNLEISHFLEKYFSIFYRDMSVFFLAIALIAITLIFYKQKLKTPWWIILSSLLAFPLLFDPIFKIGIRWYFNNWYIIVFSLTLIFFVIFSLKEIDKHLITKKHKIYFWLPLFLLFIWGALLQSQSIKNTTQFHYPYTQTDVEKVYQYLKEKGSPADIAVELSLVPIGHFRIADIKLMQKLFHDDQNTPQIQSFSIEYTKTPPFLYESRDDSILYIEDWLHKPAHKTIKIFFIARKYYDVDIAYDILLQFPKSVTIGEYAVFTLSLSSPNREKEYLQFLSKINEKTPNKYKGALLETFIYYAYKNKDKSRFDRLLQKYRDIESDSDEFIPESLEYPSKFILKRRVKYFENLKWD